MSDSQRAFALAFRGLRGETPNKSLYVIFEKNVIQVGLLGSRARV